MARFNVFKLFNNVAKAKPTNLTKQPIPSRKIDFNDDCITWDTKPFYNDFPQQLMQTVYDSPAASAALDIWHEFVEGDGFINADLDLIPVNSEETLADLHSKIADDISKFWGFAILIRYNANGEKTSFHHIPFESVRLGKQDKAGNIVSIKYNPYFGIPEDRYDGNVKTKTFYPYTPKQEDVIKQIEDHAESDAKFEYPGQVFWFSIESPLARVYPQPFYYSSINWFKIDAKIQQFHERNIDNNFLLSVLINVFGNPDQPSGPETLDENVRKDQGKTQGEEFAEMMRETFSGAKNAGAAFVNWYTRDEEKADIQPFPTNANDKLYETLQKLTTDQICIGTKVPPVLLSIREAGKLGDTQELVNSVMVMQSRVNRLQRILTSQYKKIFEGDMALANADFEIKNLNPFNILPDWAIAKLTDQEARAYINEHFPIELELVEQAVEGAPIPEEDPTNEHLRNMTGRQLQGIQRIVRKYNKGELTRAQAGELLKSSFNFSDEQIAIWLDDNDDNILNINNRLSAQG